MSGQPAQSVGKSAFDRTGRSRPSPWAATATRRRLEAQAALILRLNEEHPLSFRRELRDRLSERGVRASTSSLSRFFAGMGITRKKGAVHAAEQERPDVRAAREDWFACQPDLDPIAWFSSTKRRHDEDGPPLWSCSVWSRCRIACPTATTRPPPSPPPCAPQD